MSKTKSSVTASEEFVGNDKVLFGIIFGVLAFWLFAQTTLNIAPVMANDLGVETSIMNIAVSITALFSGIFIVVFGGLADRLGRVKVVMWGFYLSIAGSDRKSTRLNSSHVAISYAVFCMKKKKYVHED